MTLMQPEISKESADPSAASLLTSTAIKPRTWCTLLSKPLSCPAPP
ncbi:mCG1045287 [Mus musculus]|nr:mCG1045287 [Mus musculus]